MIRLPDKGSRTPARREFPARCGGNSRRGSALFMVMLVGMVLMSLAMGATLITTAQTRDRARYEVYKDEFAAAEEVLNKSYAHLQFLMTHGSADFSSEVGAMTPPVVAGLEFPTFSVNELFSGDEAITEGQWEGLTLNRLRYRIDVTARSTEGKAERFGHPGVSMSQNLQITYIPLYLFAIFYDPVLEIAPGPYMQVNGRVHSNRDLYVQSGSGIDFLKQVTSAGRIFHGTSPDSGQPNSGGAVQFSDGSLLRGMQRSPDEDGSGWLDSGDADWVSEALGEWNSRVRDSAHGVAPLSLPIPTVSDPHVLIERADPANDGVSLQNEKFEYKADLKIIVDAAGNVFGYDENGSAVDLTYDDPMNPGVTKSIVSTTIFFDHREGTNVFSVDVDMGNMGESGILPANGILYVSNEDQGTMPGVVRLVNGADLPDSNTATGFSVATDDAIFIQGDFNTVDRVPAMIAGDALYVLSNAWDDLNSANYPARNAVDTEINAVLLNGIVPSANGTYSGGVENYFRFLENWSDDDLVFSGSIVLLWLSQKAMAPWGGANVYSPPRRLWSWDDSLQGLNGPPGAPSVVEIIKTEWSLAGY